MNEREVEGVRVKLLGLRCEAQARVRQIGVFLAAALWTFQRLAASSAPTSPPIPPAIGDAEPLEKLSLACIKEAMGLSFHPTCLLSFETSLR